MTDPVTTEELAELVNANDGMPWTEQDEHGHFWNRRLAYTYRGWQRHANYRDNEHGPEKITYLTDHEARCLIKDWLEGWAEGRMLEIVLGFEGGATVFNPPYDDPVSKHPNRLTALWQAYKKLEGEEG